MKFLIILMTVGLVTSTAAEPLPPDAQVPAVPAPMAEPPPINIPPLARMQTQISQQLEILNTLREISTTLAELGPGGEQLITLLNDDRPPADRIREVLVNQSAMADGRAADLTEIMLKLELLTAIVNGVDVPPVRSDDRPAIDPNWQLARDNIRYIQMPADGVVGSVELGTAHSQATVHLGQRIVLDHQPISLTAMKLQAGERAALTFNFKDRLVTVVY